MSKILLDHVNAFKEEYLEKATSTTRVHREMTEKTIYKFYKECHLSPPSKILFFRNPFEMVAAEYIARAQDFIHDDDHEEDVRIMVYDQPWYDAGIAITSSIPQDVIESFASMNDEINKRIGPLLSVFARNVYEWVKNEINLEQVFLKLPKEYQNGVSLFKVREYVEKNEEDFIYNLYQLFGGFISSQTDTSYLKKILSVPTMLCLSRLPEYKDKLAKMMTCFDMFMSGGLFLSYKDTCFVSEPHSQLLFDHSGRLHSDTQAAVSWDGYEAYFIANVRVPDHVIKEPHKITAREIENENNQEVRRVMLERYGIDRFIYDCGAVEVQRDEYGILYKKQKNNGMLSFVKVVNGSPEPDGSYRNYILLVPSSVQTAKEGSAWTYYRTPETYNPGIRT
jgi:hypothetical protein